MRVPASRRGQFVTYKIGRRRSESWIHARWMLLIAIQRGTIALTRWGDKPSTSTKWEVNTTRRYNIASSAIVIKVDGILSLGVLDRIAEKTINENARRSDAQIISAISVPSPRYKVIYTYHRKGRCLHTRRLSS